MFFEQVCNAFLYEVSLDVKWHVLNPDGRFWTIGLWIVGDGR